MLTEFVAAPLENTLDFVARPTPQLRSAIRHYEAALAREIFAELIADLRSAFEKYTDKLREYEPGVARGTALHALMDRALKPVADLSSIRCRKGCSGCCSYEVEITRDEAAILKGIVDDGFSLDYIRLRNQAARERKSPEWNKFGSPENRCVFLGDDGACQIYEKRPSICRKHLVVSSPQACTSAGEKVTPVHVLLPEILLSAALSLEDNNYASLSKMLLTALETDSDDEARRPLVSWPAERVSPERLGSPSHARIHTLPTLERESEELNVASARG